MQTIAIILAGGVGSRLKPLTSHRAKPAVPFGGKYRIIDFTLSNCFHSGLRQILVLTQYKSHSLQKHLRDGWSVFNPSLGEYVTAVPPQMRTGDSWYAGTADAIYQNLFMLRRNPAKHVIILSGDHIYRMDYSAMVQAHEETEADATVACMNVPVAEARGFGVLNVNSTGRIVGFTEKPDVPATVPGDDSRSLASMGIYVFNREYLCDLLEADHADPSSSHDFGKDILPDQIGRRLIRAYDFGRQSDRAIDEVYWRDVGTIDAFYEANMDLLKPRAPLDLFQKNWSIRTVAKQAPPARIIPGPSGKLSQVNNSIITHGVVVAGADINNSVVSQQCRVSEGSRIENSILFDGVSVGPGCHLQNCIVDKHVKIPANTTIGVDRNLDQKRFTVSENGITVVPQDYEFAEEKRFFAIAAEAMQTTENTATTTES